MTSRRVGEHPPLSTAYSAREGLGVESGVDRRLGEAAAVYPLHTPLIVAGGRVPPTAVLIFMPLLINRRDLMREWVNSNFYNWVAWTTVVVMIGLSPAPAWMSI